jgi:hypothetical protein
MPVSRIPRMVACTGAVVVASESSNFGLEALLTLTLRTEGGDQYLVPLSEQTTRQLQKMISEFNRARDLLVLEERLAANGTPQ